MSAGKSVLTTLKTIGYYTYILFNSLGIKKKNYPYVKNFLSYGLLITLIILANNINTSLKQ